MTTTDPLTALAQAEFPGLARLIDQRNSARAAGDTLNQAAAEATRLIDEASTTINNLDLERSRTLARDLAEVVGVLDRARVALRAGTLDGDLAAEAARAPESEPTQETAR